MVLGEDAGGMALKVKHFDKDFVAWENKEDAIRFRFESVEPNDAKFSGLTMSRDGAQDCQRDLRRTRSRITSHVWPPIDPVKVGARPFRTGVEYCLYAPSRAVQWPGAA